MGIYAAETMTCVGRSRGTGMKLDGRAFHYAAYRDGLTEDLYITAAWADPAETTDITAYVCLQLDSGKLDFTAMDGWDLPVCRISWNEEADRIFIAAKGTWVNMTDGGSATNVIRVLQSRFTQLPALTMAPVLYAGYTHNLGWELLPGEDRSGFVTGLTMTCRAADAQVFTEETLAADKKLTAYALTLGEEALGSEISLTAEYRTYAPDWDGEDIEDFVTLNRYSTPVQTVERSASVPLAPACVETTLLIDGGRVTVSWPAVEDPVNTIVSYTLERSLQTKDGTVSAFVCLYSGSSTRFRDTLPAGLAAVRYRVCAVNAAGTVSAQTDTGMLEVAQSNIYVGQNGRWCRAAAVQIGSHKASPMASVGGIG